ncbi:hypothetical protein QBC40DRAFT_76503 [Triangularia verruculosa]|uniref:Uncharacterized protein n=1 Tax=Triangularia verruculosa TaxID=2587418 RepID=A0AAN7AWL2_9PEZI|nr:hypothetical protein QBC40DRAFT_76503 [Triangularia verruculosa]
MVSISCLFLPVNAFFSTYPILLSATPRFCAEGYSLSKSISNFSPGVADLCFPKPPIPIQFRDKTLCKMLIQYP